MAAIIVQIIIHECGHMAAGLAAGWRLVALRIFGLMLVRRGRQFVLASSHIPGTGGQCLMSPPDRPTAQCRLTLYNAGGFAANLITAAASLAVLLLAGRQMFIQNGVPLVLAGIPNDAMNIRYLRRDPAEADALLAMMRANAMMQDGIRLKDMPDSLFAGAQADGRQRGPISSSLDIMLLCRAIDMHDFTLAGRLADDISSRNDGTLPAIYDGEVGRERLFLALIARRPHDEIERLYDKKLRSYVKTMSSWQLSSVRLLYALSSMTATPKPRTASAQGLTRWQPATSRPPMPRARENSSPASMPWQPHHQPNKAHRRCGIHGTLHTQHTLPPPPAGKTTMCHNCKLPGH